MRWLTGSVNGAKITQLLPLLIALILFGGGTPDDQREPGWTLMLMSAFAGSIGGGVFGIVAAFASRSAWSGTPNFFAIRDIAPKADVHVLVIPKGEYVSIVDFTAKASPEAIAAFWRAVTKIARELGVGDGYRIVSNHGPNGGQLVSATLADGRTMAAQPGGRGGGQ